MESFWISEEVEVTKFHTSLPGTPVLAAMRGKHFQVQGTTAEVLRLLTVRRYSLEEIISHVQQSQPATRFEDVKEALEGLIEKRIIGSSSIARDNPAPKRSKLRDYLFNGYFVARLPLFSHRILLPVTSRLASICQPRLMAILVPLMFFFQVYFFYSSSHTVLLGLRKLDPEGLLWLLFFNYLGLLLHELGHAAACVRCGVRHGVIGFAIYLIFPAFYTDVSEAWRLDRAKRMVVDGAGIYLSLLCATIASVLWWLQHNTIAGVVAAFYDVTVLANLNPFIRMDGYWLLSDALGVPNMMTANRNLLRWVLLRPLGRRIETPVIFGLPPKLRSIYFVYFILFCGFVGYFGTMFYVWYLPRLIRFYPELISQFIAACHQHQITQPALAFLRLAFNAVPIIGPSLYLYNLLARLLRKA